MANYQWNLNLEKAIQLAHSTIIEILNEKNRPIYLSELVSLLNNRTKNIRFHQDKRLNCFSLYIL